MTYRNLLTLLTLGLLVLFGLARLSTLVNAGNNAWTSNGPAGGDISCLVVDPVTPMTLYAGVATGGVFKSTNGGVTWSAIDSSLTSGLAFIRQITLGAETALAP